MSERRAAGLRLLLIILVASNVLVLAYLLLAPEPQSETRARIEQLQINPGRINVLGTASRGPGAAAPRGPADRSVAQGACLQWGPFASSDISKVQDALARLALSDPPVQRPVSDGSGAKRFAYFLREPDAKVVAAVAELRGAFPETDIRASACP
jgi:hypothetical protein